VLSAETDIAGEVSAAATDAFSHPDPSKVMVETSTLVDEALSMETWVAGAFAPARPTNTTADGCGRGGWGVFAGRAVTKTGSARGESAPAAVISIIALVVPGVRLCGLTVTVRVAESCHGIASVPLGGVIASQPIWLEAAACQFMAP
jgi:hypothetical protein